MTYLKGYLSTNTRLDRKCGRGWEGSVGNCKRIKPSKISNAAKIGGAVAIGATIAGGGFALYKASTNEEFQSSISEKAFDKLDNIVKIDKAIDKAPLPNPLKTRAKLLSGRTKRFIGEAYATNKLKAQLIDVDNKNGISTFKKDDGSLISIGEVGDKLFMFTSEKIAEYPRPNQYEMSFSINQEYDRPAGGRKGKNEAKDILRVTQQSFQKHLSLVEEGSLLQVEAWDKDDAGKQREKIYRRMGFGDLRRRGEGFLWAQASNKKIRPIPESEKSRVDKLIVDLHMDSFFKQKHKKEHLWQIQNA